MGEISEMILESILCQVCGCVMDDLIITDRKEPPGYPRTCEDCEKGDDI